jgi:hypothetical protein
MDFETVGAEPHLGKAVAEILRTEIISTGKYRVLERAQLDRAIDEQKLQKSGIIDDKNAVEIGKLLGANYIIIGSVVKIGAAYTINSRMINIKTGEATSGKSATGNDLNRLAELSRGLLESLLGVYISKNKLPLIFEEHFIDNSRGWYLVNDQKKRFEIEDGKYILESKEGGYWMSSRRVPIKQASDFVIDMTMKKISGTDGYGFGMVWGAKDTENFYVFVITGDGHFIHERVKNGKPERILTSYEYAINKGSGVVNSLSLQKKGKDLEFYVNGKLIGKTSFLSFFGDYLGCIVYSGHEKISVGFNDILVNGQ